MKDARVAAYRTALESLMTSMDAAVRIARWTEAPDAIPAPLQKAASALDERLATATKLADSKVVGAPQVTARINAMSDCIRRLAEAYRAYRAEITDAPGTEAEAALALDVAIADVKDTDNKIA
jgi:hypothetical protein